MAPNFPELSSFSTLLKFALALEETAADLADRAAARSECAPWQDALTSCVRRHTQRRKQLEQMRRERLNEVVLQPIYGMSRVDYLPPLELPPGADGEKIIAEIVAVEAAAARFYDDAAANAANVLIGAEKTLRRLARESRALGVALAAQEGAQASF